MAGTFDSNVTSLGFYEGSIASTVVTVTGATAYVLPYDIEVVSAGIVGSTGVAAQFIHADVQVIPAGTTTATSLFSPPTAAANIATIKLDQSYVTLTTATVVSNTLSSAVTNSVTATVTSATNFAVGQGVVVAGSNVVGNYITAISSNTLTLAKPISAANGAAISAFTSPTPTAGQQVQVLGITDSFWKILNNATTGAPINTTYTVVDSSETTAAQSFRVGPLKQAGLYNTSTGFWEFTKAVQTLSAGTFQILDAIVLPGAAAGTVTNATYNYPDVVSKVDAGSTLRVVWKGITSTGIVRTTTATTGAITLSLAVKKR